ncbi:MAG: alpha/beta hydrolase [Oscillospiraceae bacterium]|nr:alpha/beta hydrolase [Oscillospiraceae bacterium]
MKIKNIMKTAGKVLLGLLILLVIFLLILFTYHRIMLNKEDELLKNYPGQIVEVSGHNMNVYAEGDGEHTLVFLAPAGDTSPALTFKPLYSKLNGEYETVVIEKFGYGMSDVVDSDRDYLTMVNECREALSKADVEAPYILCPFSKSGIDALIWAQEYPDEVEAIISIDMAFPEAYSETELPENGSTGLISVLKEMGFVRFFVNNGMYPDIYSSEEKAMLSALICRKYSNCVYVNEILTLPEACNLINSRSKPDIPIHLFLTNASGTGMDKQTWHGFSQNYVKDMKNVTVTEFDCSHGSIVNEKSEQMYKDIKAFIENLDN